MHVSLVCSELLQSLEQTLTRLKAFSADSPLIDRRMVLKLFITYFERNRDPQVMQLMLNMLQCSSEERARIELLCKPAAGHIKGIVGGGFKLFSNLLRTPASSAANTVRCTLLYCDRHIEIHSCMTA